MWQEDLKDRPMHRGIRLYFPVMGPGTVVSGDQAVRMTLTQSIRGVRVDVVLSKGNKIYYINLIYKLRFWQMDDNKTNNNNKEDDHNCSMVENNYSYDYSKNYNKETNNYYNDNYNKDVSWSNFAIGELNILTFAYASNNR